MIQDSKTDRRFARARRLGKQANLIDHLRANGYEVSAMSPYQFRVNGKIDLYPVNQNFHVLSTGERGCYETPLQICKEKLP